VTITYDIILPKSVEVYMYCVRAEAVQTNDNILQLKEIYLTNLCNTTCIITVAM
jgi:hypothetical protein